MSRRLIRPEYMDRRIHLRVSFRATAQINPDTSRPLRTARVLAQDVSLGGLQVLSTQGIDRGALVPIWIPLSGDMVLEGDARVVWTGFEDTLADSPYWLRIGLAVNLPRAEDRRLLSNFLAERAGADEIYREQQRSKIGFVF